MKFIQKVLFIATCLIGGIQAQDAINSALDDSDNIVDRSQSFYQQLQKDSEFCAQNLPEQSAVINVNQQNYEQVVTQSEKTVIMLVSATWCPPCRLFKPIFYKVAADFVDEFTFAHIDFDSFPEFIKEQEIQYVPMLLICKQGKIIAQSAATMFKTEFEHFLQTLKEQN